ncbi:hypothetical protein VTN77DRAFT_1837 [Rasamsonia byssochlamydoides]|uniref:uncharacterized protein n=1 Tax=Rasamsonia byssochlamydoides TaxID=89139 RepID=UPI0037430119
MYLASFMPEKQKMWVQAIQSRVGMISTALRSMKSVKMLGISDQLATILQAQRLPRAGSVQRFPMADSLGECGREFAAALCVACNICRLCNSRESGQLQPAVDRAGVHFACYHFPDNKSGLSIAGIDTCSDCCFGLFRSNP